MFLKAKRDPSVCNIPELCLYRPLRLTNPDPPTSWPRTGWAQVQLCHWTHFPTAMAAASIPSLPQALPLVLPIQTHIPTHWVPQHRTGCLLSPLVGNGFWEEPWPSPSTDRFCGSLRVYYSWRGGQSQSPLVSCHLSLWLTFIWAC